MQTLCWLVYLQLTLLRRARPRCAQIKLLKAYEKTVARLIADTYDLSEEDAGAFGPDTHEHAYVVAKLRESNLDFLRGGQWLC
jgi:hypothetical protein